MTILAEIQAGIRSRRLFNARIISVQYGIALPEADRIFADYTGQRSQAAAVLDQRDHRFRRSRR